MNEKFEEGVHSIRKKKTDSTPEETDKLKIDKKKLVIYSEIMKPKFDDGLI